MFGEANKVVQARIPLKKNERFNVSGHWYVVQRMVDTQC